MQDFATTYIVKILPNGCQCLSANTGLFEILDKDSNVYELVYETEQSRTNDNNNHTIDDDDEYHNVKYQGIYNRSNTTRLKHCPISYENNLDKLCKIIDIVAH